MHPVTEAVWNRWVEYGPWYKGDGIVQWRKKGWGYQVRRKQEAGGIDIVILVGSRKRAVRFAEYLMGMFEGRNARAGLVGI